MTVHPDVMKTYKLFVGGEFRRPGSGRAYTPAACAHATNVARGSAEDVRDGVNAARKAVADWSARAPYNRGQILYRLAEIVQGRRDAFTAELRACGATPAAARTEVQQTIDLAVWYAGLPDKLDVLLGSHNPVSGPFLCFTTAVPTGVVAVAAPPKPMLLGLVAMVLPVLAGGNTVVALCSEVAPLPAVALGEACATADVPPGVVNLLTGLGDELLPELFAHRDVNAVFAAGTPDPILGALAAEGVTRVRWLQRSPGAWRKARTLRQLSWVEPFVELKTQWHPVALQ